MPEFNSVRSALSVEWMLRLTGLLLFFVLAGWTWSRHFSSQKSERLLWSILIGMHAIPLALFFPVAFSPTSVSITGIVMAATGWLSARNIGFVEPASDRVRRIVMASLTVALTALWCIWTLRTQAFTHYDYYLNSNLMSLDLALTGSKSSAWAVEHDIHNWFLIQLTSTVAMDALEMQWLHSNSNLLPRLLELVSMIGVVSLLVRKTRPGALFFSLVCALYLFEQSIQFRPHLHVGLFIAMGALILSEDRASFWKVAVVCLCLALSKRDGLVLAPVLLIFSFRKFQFSRHGIIGLILIFTAASFLKIGGRTPLVFLYQSLFHWKNLQAAFALASEPLFVAAIVAFSYLIWRTAAIAQARRPLVLCAATIMMTLAGSLILVDAGFLTPGTNQRKVLYIIAPVVLALLSRYACPATFSMEVRNQQTLATAFFSMLLVLTVGWPLVNAAKVKVNWTTGALNGTHYLRSLIKGHDRSLKIGVYRPEDNAIDLSIFGDLYTFRWPFLIAYLGHKISFLEDTSSFSASDIVFLPPMVSEKERLNLAKTSGFIYYKTYGVYGLLVKPEIKTRINLDELKTGPAGEALLAPTEMTDIASSQENWMEPSGVRVVDTPYPNGALLQQIIWPEDSSTFSQPAKLAIPNAAHRFIRNIEFQVHPFGGNFPHRIEIGIGEKRTMFEINHVMRDGIFNLPVHSDKPINLYLYNDGDRSGPSKSPYFYIFALKAESDMLE